MDEPLSNLDAKLRTAMRAEITRVHRTIGAATLYVTHDQVEAMTMGDRIAVLDRGVLQQYGTPRTLYSRPANLFVASFIGSPEMNLWEGALEGGTLVLGSQRLALSSPGGATPRGTPGRKVSIPGMLGDSEHGAALIADVRVVESAGSEVHAFFDPDNGQAIG